MAKHAKKKNSVSIRSSRVKARRYYPEFQEGLDAVAKIDPSLEPFIKKHEFPSFYKDSVFPSSFEYLVRCILSQQISGMAAKSIRERFKSLFDKSTFPTPQEVSIKTVEDLRKAGLSTRKSEYVIGLALAYVEGRLSDAVLLGGSDEEIVSRILAIRGLGPWTAEMFLFFYLRRMNVFSANDLGVRRGFKSYILTRLESLEPELRVAAQTLFSVNLKGKSATNKQTEFMVQYANRFTPYRGAFQMILWKISDIEMQTIEAVD